MSLFTVFVFHCENFMGQFVKREMCECESKSVCGFCESVCIYNVIEVLCWHCSGILDSLKQNFWSDVIDYKAFTCHDDSIMCVWYITGFRTKALHCFEKDCRSLTSAVFLYTFTQIKDMNNVTKYFYSKLMLTFFHLTIYIILHQTILKSVSLFPQKY